MVLPQPLPGTYALIFSAVAEQRLRIGRLGQLHVRPGFYVYVGSAFGPGGVRARIAYQRRSPRHPHWHIDYVKCALRLEEIWWTHDARRREHQWASVMPHMGGTIPLGDFGASDCTCASHLSFFSTPPSLAVFRKVLRRAFPSHKAVHKQIAGLSV
jgi:Uri superfamily endonuclease